MSVPQADCPGQSPSRNSRLLQLPAEISDEIYKYVLSYPTPIHLVGWTMSEEPKILFPRINRDDTNTDSTSRRRSHFICTTPPLGISCHHTTETCWMLTHHMYPGQTLPRVHLDLLLTCRQIYAQTLHLFYSSNVFEIGVVFGYNVSVSTSAWSILQQIGPLARSSITNLYISDIFASPESWRRKMSEPSLPSGCLAERRGSEPADEASQLVWEMETLCGMLAEMKSLRNLGLQFSYPDMYSWNGKDAWRRINDIPFVQPLLGVFKPTGGIACCFWVIARKLDVVAYVDNPFIERNSPDAKFEVALAEEIRRRRGSEWGGNGGVECIMLETRGEYDLFNYHGPYMHGSDMTQFEIYDLRMYRLGYRSSDTWDLVHVRKLS